jgi:hypothetical protein
MGGGAGTSTVGTNETAPQVLKPAVAAAVAVPPAYTAADGPFIVAADCRPQIDNVMAVLKAGVVIEDYSTAVKLLAAGAPIVPVNAAHDLTCCPRCQNIFKPSPLDTRRALRRAG